MQEQRPQEDLVYADVNISSKYKKTTTTHRSVVPTTQPDITVEYSAINFKSCNDQKPVNNMAECPTHGTYLVLLTLFNNILCKYVAQWYNFIVASCYYKLLNTINTNCV